MEKMSLVSMRMASRVHTWLHGLAGGVPLWTGTEEGEQDWNIIVNGFEPLMNLEEVQSRLFISFTRRHLFQKT